MRVGSSENPIRASKRPGEDGLASKKSGDRGKIHSGKIRSSAHADTCSTTVRILLLFADVIKVDCVSEKNKVNSFLLPEKTGASPDCTCLPDEQNNCKRRKEFA